MALASFDHDLRTRLVFGPGTLDRLGELSREYGAKRVLLVTDPGIRAAGHVDRGVGSLRGVGLMCTIFDKVGENPTTQHVDAGVAVARDFGADFIVGLGGGSSMDCAKGINFIVTQGGEMKDYRGVGRASRPMLPFIAVPTTAGTGSESQSFALISDPVTHEKMACGDKKAAARAAILDPDLTLTQPRAVAAATGIDAISHAMETLVTRRRNSLSRLFSIEAWRLLEPSYERVLEEPGDREARGRMLLGATLGGAAIESSMLGAAHAAANPLTARFGFVHGHAVGMLLPHVVRFNAALPEAEHEMCCVAPSAGALADRLDALFAASGLPPRLSSKGVREADLGVLAKEAAVQWTARFNPREVREEDFVEIYRCVL
jgi:alcohol dehydrogenase